MKQPRQPSKPSSKKPAGARLRASLQNHKFFRRERISYLLRLKHASSAIPATPSSIGSSIGAGTTASLIWSGCRSHHYIKRWHLSYCLLFLPMIAC